jgi:hypothetical protein
MKSRKFVVRIAALLGAAVAAVAATAAGTATPDPAQIALRATDIPGAKVSGKVVAPSAGYAASYARAFSLSKPYGASRIVFVESDVELATVASTATKDMAGVKAFLRSSKGKEQLAAAIVKSLGKTVTRKNLTFAPLRTPRIGDEAIEVPATIKVKTSRLYTALTFFRVDRAFATLTTVSLRPTGQGDVVKLGSLVVAHAGEQFLPIVAGPPTIAGTAIQGQTLTAAPGTWTNTPTLTHQWQHCDATGAACADIPGATTPTYAVTPADVGATLRVTVTGTNRFGKATSQSVQTAVVA